MKPRTRVAPSPTGLAHIGTAYQALFNYAYARKEGGEFIVRIEDTDVKRHVKEAEEAIYDAFAWLSIDYDEAPNIGGKFAPYRQSERLDLYKKYIKELLDKGLAYEDEGAIRLKVEKRGKTSWKDLVRGEISFENSDISDFVILKSDGFPTYNFAVVIDDIQMEITHVARGEEHISNTPRQIMIYKALGKEIPFFAHTPVLRNKDHSKVSKRKNPVAISFYKEEGYLPEAIINFLAHMGWSHPEGKEVFSKEEFVKNFSFERMSTSAPIFDLEKLAWLNGVYIREKKDKDLADLLIPFAPEKMSKDLILKTVPLIKTRISKLKEYKEMISFLVENKEVDEELLFKKGEKEFLKEQLELTLNLFENLKDNEFKLEILEKEIRSLADRKNWKIGKYFMGLRIALTGKTITPPLFESIILLGKEKSILRLKEILNKKTFQQDNFK
jgi:glutamyl-tRNA synthetase